VGIVFGVCFDDGRLAKNVAKALIPIDVSHLALAKEVDVREIGK